MTENENPARPPEPGGRGPLRRERTARMIAGVCGGLGRHLDVDPVVFRILFAVLTFFGGVGLLAYAAAWLLVPAEDESESEAQKLLSGHGTATPLAVAALLVLGFLSMTTTLTDGFHSAMPLLVIAAAVIAVVAWRREGPHPGASGRAPYAPGGGSAGGADQPQPWWQRPVRTTAAPGFDQRPADPPVADRGGPAGAGDRPEEGMGPGAAAGGPDGADGPAAGFSSQSTAMFAPVPVAARRRYGGLVAACVLAALGLLGVLAAAGAFHIGWTAKLALAVMALGAGMAIGGLFGRVRWLIPVALTLAVPLIAANALNVPLRGETGDVSWSPSSAAVLDSPYELGAGRGTLDLSAVDPAGGTVRVAARVGAGRLLVTVPAGMALRVNAHIGFGSVEVLSGPRTSGIDLTKNLDFLAVGPSRGTLVLDLKVGAGDVEVERG